MHTPNHQSTRETADVFARRLEVVRRMLAGEASYDEVLAFHAEDFLWLSPAGAVLGHAAAREYSAGRMAKLPPGALAGLQILQTHVVGEYAFLTFKTDLVPFGTDTFRICNGKVVFQSNAVYL